jgi:hypothetical protein
MICRSGAKRACRSISYAEDIARKMPIRCNCINICNIFPYVFERQPSDRLSGGQSALQNSRRPKRYNKTSFRIITYFLSCNMQIKCSSSYAKSTQTHSLPLLHSMLRNVAKYYKIQKKVLRTWNPVVPSHPFTFLIYFATHFSSIYSNLVFLESSKHQYMTLALIA